MQKLPSVCHNYAFRLVSTLLSLLCDLLLLFCMSQVGTFVIGSLLFFSLIRSTNTGGSLNDGWEKQSTQIIQF
jgi:hypothetical protein